MKRWWLAVTAYLVLTGCTCPLHRDDLRPPKYKVGDVLQHRWRKSDDRFKITAVDRKERFYNIRAAGEPGSKRMFIRMTEYLFKPVQK